MKVVAPGKLLLAGAYAVLDGAPALVVAVDRRAIADGDAVAKKPTPEVLAAVPAAEAPEVDASALRDGAFKLGLGSSAAMLVASLGVVHVRKGSDLGSKVVRDAIFATARQAHASVQNGGSGVDIAASVYGGALAYTLAANDGATVRAVTLPAKLVVDVFWCGAPAVTTGMRARVDALRARDASVYAARIDSIAAASKDAIAAVEKDDLAAFVTAEQAGGDALAALGRDADSPIIPSALAGLLRLAAEEGAAFLPSGAGGGDVFVHLGADVASPRFTAAATAASMRRVSMALDSDGVRIAH